MNKDVTEQFLKDTERDNQVDILEQPLDVDEYGEPFNKVPADDTDDSQEPDGQDPDGEDPEEEEEDTPDEPNKVKPKNRRERRLQRALEAERESSRQMADKLQNVSAAASDIKDAEYLTGIDRIYGNETPEAQMATDLLKKALVGIRQEAEDNAYNRVKSERDAEAQAEANQRQQLDNFLNEVEDTYGVNLTEAQEKNYLTLLEKMSPKDNKGKVTTYADPLSVYEVFKERSSNRKTPQRAKNVANRSLNQGGSPDDSKIQNDSAVRFLTENGLI